MMKCKSLVIFLLCLLTISCSASQLTHVEDRRDELVSKGWQLVKRWDFYNQLDGWNVTQLIKPKSGGRVQVNDGIFDLGFSVNGGMVFSPLEIEVIPNASYMLIGRMKTNSPKRNTFGFFTPPNSELNIYQRIRNHDWSIVKVIYSVLPLSNLDIPDKIYPAIELKTRRDAVSVDWVELWVYLPKK